MWRCKSCHSTAVEGNGWVSLNDDSSGIGDDATEYWCNSCEANTEVYFKEEPNEETFIDDQDYDYNLDIDVPG